MPADVPVNPKALHPVADPDLFVRYQLRHPEAKVPTYANPGDAGADLYAVHFDPPAFHEPHNEWPAAVYKLDQKLDDKEITVVVLHPGRAVLVHLELTVEIPKGWEASIRPRSGMAFKHGISSFHPIGTIDQGFLGKMDVLLINRSGAAFPVKRGDRVAQIVFTPVGRATFNEADLEAVKTQRGQGGYGSSGR